MRWWLKRVFLASLLVIAITVVFRQGLLPARMTPLPRLNLANPLPLIVDWQIAELRYDRDLCRAILADGKTITARPIPDRPLRKGCGWINAVHMSRAGGAALGVNRVSCQVAAATALWVRHVVQPEAQRIFGSQVASIDNLGTYSCRNIVGNSFWQDRRSEHATANAIDIAGFRLANGETISVRRDWQGSDKKSEFLRAVHQGACRYFRVSLSPNFNASHNDHFHFDRSILWTCH
jgi:hypothetical protein